MQLAITLEHPDPAYVEHRGGFAMLTYLRGAPERAEHRRISVSRAHQLFLTAQAEARPSAETGGLGLLVLQRALLAAEDLGLLLHAFDGPQPWERLRTAKIPDLDAVFLRAASRSTEFIERVFRLPNKAELEREAEDALQRSGLLWLRDNAERRWSDMLTRASWLWLEHRNVAKATMHGFPIVAGSHIDGPPGAGELSVGIRRQKERYAVAVTSKTRGKDVVTDRTTLHLGERAVGSFARHARVAIRATADLAEAQAGSTMRTFRATMPTRAMKFLDSETRAALEPMVDEEESPDDV
jgi:hypothetical protein